MAQIITYIPAVPRSNTYKYYLNASNTASKYTTSSTVNPSNPDDNFGAELNIIGTGNVVSSLSTNVED